MNYLPFFGHDLSVVWKLYGLTEIIDNECGQFKNCAFPLHFVYKISRIEESYTREDEEKWKSIIICSEAKK